MPDFAHELRGPGPVAGVDEVGRGPLAGPVVAAAVMFTRPPAAELTAGIDDSKKLREARRREIDARLRAAARAGDLVFAIAAVSAREIDRINILAATMLAMRRAVARLNPRPNLVLVDGNRAPDFGRPARCIVGGDAKSLSIAAASILAKVARDRLMDRLGARYPGYGWADNRGYGAKIHLQAIESLGPTPHHRLSFSPFVQGRLNLA